MVMKYDKEFQKPDGRKLTTGGPRDLQRKQRMQDRQQSELIVYLQEEIRRLNKELATADSGEYTGEQVDEEIRKAVSAALMEVKDSYDEDKKEFQSAVEAFKKNEKNLLEQIKNLEIYQLGVKNDLDKFKLERDKAVSEKKELEDESSKRDNLNTLHNKDMKKFQFEIEFLIKEKTDIINKHNNEITKFKIESEKKKGEVKSLKEKAKRIGADEEITTLLKEQTKQIEVLTEALANAETQLEIETNRPKMETAFIDPLEKDAGKDLTPHIEIKEEKPAEEKGEMNAKVERLRSLMGKLPKVNG